MGTHQTIQASDRHLLIQFWRFYLLVVASVQAHACTHVHILTWAHRHTQKINKNNFFISKDPFSFPRLWSSILTLTWIPLMNNFISQLFLCFAVICISSPLQRKLFNQSVFIYSKFCYTMIYLSYMIFPSYIFDLQICSTVLCWLNFYNMPFETLKISFWWNLIYIYFKYISFVLDGMYYK